MGIIHIRYRFILGGERDETFDLRIDSHRLELIDKPLEDVIPAWTKLDFHQCQHCPLNIVFHPNCPVAVRLAEVARRFEAILSYDEIDLEVVTEERRILQHTTAQRGLSSMLGLMIATSGCPHTAFFKPMARFHLPLSTKVDTIFRATGMYLLAQYFLRKEGKEVNFSLEGLKEIYNNLHVLNSTIVKRLRNATNSDSSINAIILLDTYTNSLLFGIINGLEEIRYLFDPYLSDPHGIIDKQLNDSEDSA